MAANADVKTLSELVFTRTFDAPRALVWHVWTDPKHIGSWWGPKGFTTRVETQDFRPGGTILLHLSGPDGRSWPCRGTYREIMKPERIVYAGIADEDNPCGAGLPPHSVVTVTFAETGHRTIVTIHTALETPADRDAAIAHGFREGWEASFDHFASHLATIAKSQ
jgi:uncharacterized protein YndB with AHSA1/START domain